MKNVLFIIACILVVLILCIRLFESIYNDKTTIQVEKIQQIQPVEVIVNKRVQGTHGYPYFFVVIESNGKYSFKEDINLYHKYDIGDTIK
jgi:hypothetical protein